MTVLDPDIRIKSIETDDLMKHRRELTRWDVCRSLRMESPLLLIEGLDLFSSIILVDFKIRGLARGHGVMQSYAQLLC